MKVEHGETAHSITFPEIIVATYKTPLKVKDDLKNYMTCIFNSE